MRFILLFTLGLEKKIGGFTSRQAVVSMNDISIIIPTCNRAGALLQAMTSIATVVASRDPVEIIVVDNGSIDDTAGICREIKDRFPKHNWRYFYDETPGLLTGRHLGAREAQGDILAFLDDDVLLAPSWLEALDDAFGDPEVMLTGGPVWPHYEVEPPSWLAGMWVEFEEGPRARRAQPSRPRPNHERSRSALCTGG